MFLKVSNTIYTGVLFFALLGVTACERTSPSTAESTNEPRTRAEEDLAELRAWMNEKTNSSDSTNSERWPAFKEDFKQRSAILDARFDSLSEESKAEYKELRRKYQNWEARNQQRSEIPLHPETLQRFEQELFGSANALGTQLTPAQIQDVYSQFLQNVRARRANWTSADWDYADHFYRLLNQKKDAVEEQIPAKDKLKIKALQAEYLTLETSKDAKELYKEVK